MCVGVPAKDAIGRVIEIVRDGGVWVQRGMEGEGAAPCSHGQEGKERHPDKGWEHRQHRVDQQQVRQQSVMDLEGEQEGSNHTAMMSMRA